MNLVGQAVKHKKYGKGVITDLFENKITVCFAEGQKLFLYPDSFPNYLTLKNNSIQKKVEKLNEVRVQGVEERRQKVEIENRYHNRIYAMKILSKAQVAYDISLEDIRRAKDLEFVDTGCFLSGNMKGKPRIPSSIQPNTAIILTHCSNEAEGERSIIGIAMVDGQFWGDECKDGHIRLHKQHKLILPDKRSLSFWKYFKREAFPLRWSSVPFKYFQNHTMQKIILDICNESAGTPQEEEAMNLYRYFCSINRLPEKQIKHMQ